MLQHFCVTGLLSKVERKINKAQDEIVRHLHASHLRDNLRTRLVQPVDDDSYVDILRLKGYLIFVMVDLVDFDRTFEYHYNIFGSVYTLLL